MTRRLFSTGTLAALLALAAACDQASTLPAAEGITRAEAESLVSDYDLIGAAVVDGFGVPSFSLSADGEPSAAATASTTQFSHLRNCPLGGTVTLSGTVTHSYDRETKSGTRQSTATRTESACAFRARRSGATLTLNGSPSVQITAGGSIANGEPGVRTMTQKGAFTWARSTGQSGTCTVDLTSTFDPATRTHTLKGTFCSHTVDLTHTRPTPA